MGWMETCAVDERMRFVMAVEERDSGPGNIGLRNRDR